MSLRFGIAKEKESTVRTEEDEAWEELERKQNHAQGWRKRQIAEKQRQLDDDDTMCYRNDVLEEAAQRIEEFKIPFAADTVASFAALIREMKR